MFQAEGAADLHTGGEDCAHRCRGDAGAFEYTLFRAFHGSFGPDALSERLSADALRPMDFVLTLMDWYNLMIDVDHLCDE